MEQPEALSRLLAGELDEAEATALRARVAREPELAASLDALRQLVDDLEALPEVTPPAALDAAVLAGRAPARPTARWWPGLAVAAVAALALVAVRPEAPAPVLVPAGTVEVRGPAVVQAPDVVVTVDGAVVIDVEPPEDALRDRAHLLEDPMSLSHLLSAASGAAVTVVVLEGTATVQPDDGPARALSAGDVHRVAPASTRFHAAPPPAGPHTPSLPAAASAPSEVEALRARVAALEDELSRARLVAALQEGQVHATQGPPSPWPAEVLPGLEPDAFTARVREAAAARGVPVTISCDEYPCLALLSTTADGPDWEAGLRDLPEALAEELGASVSVFASHMRNDRGAVGVLGFAVAPPEDLSRDGDVGVRLHFRADTLTEDLGRELLSP